MLRRSRIAAASVTVVALVLASSATATTPPSGNGLRTNPVMCGVPGSNDYTTPGTLTKANGASFYITIDGSTSGYEVTSIRFTTNGITATKSYGNRTGQTSSIECTGTTPTGTFFDGVGVTVA